MKALLVGRIGQGPVLKEWLELLLVVSICTLMIHNVDLFNEAVTALTNN